MNSILKRAHHVLLVIVAALFATTLLTPIAGLANTGLTIGDQAIVSNPNGTGANLRTDPSLDDATISAELPQGALVTIQDTPLSTETGFWVFVSTDFGNGFVDASLLAPVDAPVTDEGETQAPVEQPVSNVLPYGEQIDTGFVVDNNNILTAEGLACRVTATLDGEIITRIPVGTTLQVTEARIYDGEQTYVHVNCADGSGYVNGDFVTLQSEQIEEPIETEAPVEPEVTETEVPTETEAPVEPEVTETEAPVEPEVTETEVPTETEAPVEPEVTETEAPVEPEVTETEVPTETEAPVEPEVTETEVPTETEAPVEPEVTETEVTETEAPEISSADDATPEETLEATPSVDETETPDETEEAEPTEDTTETPVVDEDATPTEDVSPESTTEATPGDDEQVEAPQAPATTAPAFDMDAVIGSATVTGTNGEGLRCRVAPSDDAATLMMLNEGTKVYVSAEATNGYLGIDCGGLQGFADVNFLWSGGASDGEIQKSNLTLVITGTGNGLNCRTGASTSYPVITVLRDGQSVTSRGKASNGWVAVVCAGQNGFVATTWVEVGGDSGSSSGSSSNSGSNAISGTATVVNTNGDGLYCRSGAGTSYSAITVLSPGQQVSVRGANQGAWVPIVCGGQNGFAHSDYMSVTAGSGNGSGTNPGATKPSAPGASTGTLTVTNTGGDGLNCRSGAGTGNGVITVLRPGQKVDARSGSKDGWQAVICGGQNGFVSSQYVTSGGGDSTPSQPDPTPNPPASSGLANGAHAETQAALNLRYEPSLGSGVAVVAPAGTVVLITGGASNGFYPVDWDGLKGYMSGDYLAKTDKDLSKRGGSADPGPSNPPAGSEGSSATGNAMVDYAMRYLGYPYVWATHGPSSFDCSGFTYWVTLNVTGKDIGTGTWTQVSAGQRVSKSELQPGDLVFFQNTYTAGLSHVGIYIGGGQFIHAENENTGVRISELDSSYYGPRWYGAVRI